MLASASQRGVRRCGKSKGYGQKPTNPSRDKQRNEQRNTHKTKKNTVEIFF